MLKGKKILVTSGGTQEYIDDVRVLTNISSGRLGAIIAEKLAEDYGAEVHYVHARTAVMPGIIPTGIQCKFHKVTTAMEAFSVMMSLVPEMDAVIHCMAVSDFTFKRDRALKCKSANPQAFIDFMRDTITVNPKIISEIKNWNPKVKLIGFKFEVGLDHEELLALAQSSIQKNGCDMVIANDKLEMIRERTHVAYAVLPDDNTNVVKMMGKEKIAETIGTFLSASFSCDGLEI